MNKIDILKRWPLFSISTKSDYSPSEENGWYYLKVNTSELRLHDENKPLSDNEISRLDLAHRNLEQSIELNSKFSNLHILVSNGKVHCWLKVNDQGREGLEKYDLSTPYLTEILSQLNDKVSFVFKNPKNYFTCSFCKEACLFNKEQDLKLDHLLNEKSKFLKFRDAGAGFYCDDCVEQSLSVKKEYELSIKLGSRYYD